MKKMPVPRFQFYFFSPKLCFCFCELLWFWKWRRFLNFYPMKTLLSRNSEVKSQVGYSQIRNELIETSPTSHRNLCFEVANSEMRFRAQSSLSGSAARLLRLLSRAGRRLRVEVPKSRAAKPPARAPATAGSRKWNSGNRKCDPSQKSEVAPLGVVK